MKAHSLYTSTYVNLEVERVFPFFTDVVNLQRVTPPELDFRILTPLPIEIRLGTVVNYRLRLLGLPLTWTSEITHWEPPRRFVDSQVVGPYSQWIHTHNFYSQDDGTLIEDDVSYRLPYPPWGEIAYPLVWAQLRRIFSYRQRVIRQLLTGGADESGRKVGIT
jgi:ligand-binding SRPBCC domain-containing protein